MTTLVEPADYPAAVAAALLPLRRERSAPPPEASACFPVSARYAPPSTLQPSPDKAARARAQGGAPDAVAFAAFEGQDFAAAARLRGELSAGRVLSGLVGAWSFEAVYDELRASPRALAPGPPRDEDDEDREDGEDGEDGGGAGGDAGGLCFAVGDGDGALLCGRHSARLTLRADGSFRARCRHDAAGPGAEDRSLALDARGRWAYLLGEQRLVLAPADAALRLAVAGLALDRDASRCTLTISRGARHLAAPGAPGAPGARGGPVREWRTLRYALRRADELADAPDARDARDSRGLGTSRVSFGASNVAVFGEDEGAGADDGGSDADSSFAEAEDRAPRSYFY